MNEEDAEELATELWDDLEEVNEKGKGIRWVFGDSAIGEYNIMDELEEEIDETKDTMPNLEFARG